MMYVGLDGLVTPVRKLDLNRAAADTVLQQRFDEKHSMASQSLWESWTCTSLHLQSSAPQL
jgi:hypothetical protein